MPNLSQILTIFSLFVLATTFSLALPSPEGIDGARRDQNARQMLRPQFVPDGQKAGPKLDYFNARTYTPRDFPRLIEGLGRQLSRDLDKAHNEYLQFTNGMQALQHRVVQLELQFAELQHANHVVDTWTKSLALLAVALFGLLLALVLAIKTLRRGNYDKSVGPKRFFRFRSATDI